MLTSPRMNGASYINGTIASMLRADSTMDLSKLHVFSDEPTAPPELAYDVPVRCATEAEHARKRNENAYAVQSYAAELAWLGTGSGLCCTSEDDMIHAKNWIQRAEALAEMCDARAERWILPLMHFYELSDFTTVGRSHFGDELLLWTDKTKYYGTQTIVYRPATCALLSQSIRNIIGKPRSYQYAWNQDMALKASCIEHDVTIYAANPCLVQHVGETSAAHKARSFIFNRYFDDKQ